MERKHWRHSSNSSGPMATSQDGGETRPAALRQWQSARETDSTACANASEATSKRVAACCCGVPEGNTAPAFRNTPGEAANQPATSNVGDIPIAPDKSVRLCVGRIPYTPQNEAGTRHEPPVSLPNARSQAPAATAAAEPLEEPPGKRPLARGLTGVP